MNAGEGLVALDDHRPVGRSFKNDSEKILRNSSSSLPVRSPISKVSTLLYVVAALRQAWDRKRFEAMQSGYRISWKSSPVVHAMAWKCRMVNIGDRWATVDFKAAVVLILMVHDLGIRETYVKNSCSLWSMEGVF